MTNGRRRRERNLTNHKSVDLTSLEAEAQVCARVLTHLAQGTTPTHIISPSSIHHSSNQNKNSNSTSSTINDEKGYNNHTDAEHHELLTVALSILLDSTSPGPDPLALKSLGWAYGMGGGGGMGDWDGCHYMPGSIGQTLRVLQDQVVVQLVEEYNISLENYNNNNNSNNTDAQNVTDGYDYLNHKKAWWLQNHEVEYERGIYERSATRFCTIGGISPWTVPYTQGGVLWGPPLAGVCVPSSCTANGLYMLFDEENGFADSLLAMATQSGGFYDDNYMNDINDESRRSPPTASRRFRYMSSLAQSFHAGRVSQMGIVCEGESGLDELDIEGYTSLGYRATVALIVGLCTCVLLGTVSSAWFLGFHHEKKRKNRKDEGISDDTSSVSNSHQDHEEDHEDDEDASEDEEKAKSDSKRDCTSLLMENYNGIKYGSDRGNGTNDDIIVSPNNKSVSFSNWPNRHPTEIEPTTSSEMEHDENETETDPLLQSNRELKIIKLEEKRGIEFQRSASFSIRERRKSYQDLDLMYHISTFVFKIKYCFAYFDAGQSFYEITRMTREDPYVDSLHQQRLRKAGETSLDPSSSTPGLFPMYKALGSNSRATSADSTTSIHPDQTVSISSSKSLNGMRSISMLWIIFGHTLAVQSSVGYVNPAALLPPTGMMTSTLGKIVLSARYAVDTFFFIGGFLVMSGLLKRLDPALKQNVTLTLEDKAKVETWKQKMIRWRILNPRHLVIGEYVNRLKQQDSNSSSSDRKNENAAKGLLWVIPFLLHRILRILPTYGFVLLLWWKIAVMLGDGPFWPRWATFVAQCDAHAWTNMLFVNNLVPRVQPFGESSECMYHAWYLGVDFQLCLVLAPVFVTLYLRKGWRVQTIVLEVLTVVAIIIASLHCSFKYNWSANLWDGADTVAFDVGFYINPIFRSTPYIIGFITGQIWHEKCRLCPNVGLTRTIAVLLSIISIMIMIYWSAFAGGSMHMRPCQVWESPRYTECGGGLSATQLAIFNSFGRPIWGLGLALISLLSFNGQLTFLWSSTILTWPGWDPISKLSFSMYLLHPLVINIWVLGGDDKFRFSLVDLFFAFAGIVLITFIVALVIGVLVEWPMSRITRDFEKRLWSKKKSKRDDRIVSEENVPQETVDETLKDCNNCLEGAKNEHATLGADNNDYQHHIDPSST